MNRKSQTKGKKTNVLPPFILIVIHSTSIPSFSPIPISTILSTTAGLKVHVASLHADPHEDDLESVVTTGLVFFRGEFKSKKTSSRGVSCQLSILSVHVKFYLFMDRYCKTE